MKKTFFIIILMAAILSSFVVNASATNDFKIKPNDNEIITDITYFEDGSYIVESIYQSPIPKAEAYTTHQYKHTNFYDSNGVLQWSYTLDGVFYVNTGVSCTCIDSLYTYTIYNDSWDIYDAQNHYSGNTAYGTATFKKKLLFITIDTRDISLQVSCDEYGNIS